MTDPNGILAGFAMGLGATLAIDLWAVFLHRRAGIAPTDWGLVGRWVCGIPQGRVCLAAGDFRPPGSHERLLGWLTHYTIGIAYALAYLTLLHTVSLEVSLLSALLFGLVTVLAPWLILQPALGKGAFASATPRPRLTRLQNITVHLLFGAGLYLTWLLIATVHG